MTSQADSVREYVIEHYVRPFLESNEAALFIRAGDVVRGMRLVNSTPAVCSALRASKFQQETGVGLVGRTGPRQSTTTTFRYERGAQAADCGAGAGFAARENSTNRDHSEGTPSSEREHRQTARTTLAGFHRFHNALQRPGQDFIQVPHSERSFTSIFD